MKKGQHKYFFNRKIFDNIDTSEKAYWHGLISADGYVNTKNFSLGLQMSVKDEILGDRFISFLRAPKEIKKYRIKRKDKYHCKNREYRYFSIVVYSEKLVRDFLKHAGLECLECNKKFDRLTLPDFGNEKLNLSWLMGYYDGDGSEKIPRIASSSLKLLDQIKTRYGIPFDITHNKNVYILYIGEYFREKLCENYIDSLPRKRVEIIGRNFREKNKNLDNLTPEILSSLVKTHSLSEIGEMFGVGRVSVFVKTKRLSIAVPQRKGGRKSRKFFIRTECKYFPCHELMETCNLCYCPLFTYDNCGGKYKILENGIKDCSNCYLPHSEKGHDYIVEFLKKNIRKF